MRFIRLALATSAIVAVPTTFLSMSVVSVPNTSYFEYLMNLKIWIMIIQIFSWCFVGALVANFLMFRLAGNRINSVYLALTFVLISSLAVAVVMAYLSTTLYQSIAFGHFTSVGTFPHSLSPYLAAVKSYFLCALFSCVFTLLLVKKSPNQ